MFNEIFNAPYYIRATMIFLSVVKYNHIKLVMSTPTDQQHQTLIERFIRPLREHCEMKFVLVLG